MDSDPNLFPPDRESQKLIIYYGEASWNFFRFFRIDGTVTRRQCFEENGKTKFADNDMMSWLINFQS